MKLPRRQSMYNLVRALIMRLLLRKLFMQLLAPMAPQLTPAEAQPMRMALVVEQLIPTAPLHMLTGLTEARLTTIQLLILPMLMAPKEAPLTPMMVRELLMARTVEQRPGVMVQDLLLALTVAQPIGVMVPVPPKVRVAVRLVGIVVPVALQHLLAANPKAGAGKLFMV